MNKKFYFVLTTVGGYTECLKSESMPKDNPLRYGWSWCYGGDRLKQKEQLDKVTLDNAIVFMKPWASLNRINKVEIYQ